MLTPIRTATPQSGGRPAVEIQRTFYLHLSDDARSEKNLGEFTQSGALANADGSLPCSIGHDESAVVAHVLTLEQNRGDAVIIH